MLTYDQARGDDARLYWCLKDGSMSHKRIYATMRHLFSTLTMSQVKDLIDKHLHAGNIEEVSHPIHNDRCFYKLSIAVQKTINNDT